MDFLRQLDIRLLGNNVSLDSDKLAFALHALHGPAHEWYIGLRLRADFSDTFEYFRSRFCHKYRIPGYLPHEFDFALIAKQLPEEDPTQYLARISNYVNNSAPLESFVRFDAQDTAAFQAYYESKIGGEDADAASVHVKNISILCGLRWAKRIPVSYTHLTLPTNREV